MIPAPPNSPAPGGAIPNKSPNFPYLNPVKPTTLPATVSHTTRTFPFGEEMAAQHAGGEYATRYKFNGKELDPETGYYYYGARYYDPVVSRWLSIDPLAEKYPGLSPYNYTANNPVMLVDPDGRCFRKVGKFFEPCEDAPIGSTTTGAFGYSWTMTKDGWQLTNGADPKTVKYDYDNITPTGLPDYYIKRYLNHINKYHTRPPDYYLAYGYKYCYKFNFILKFDPELSEVAKIWITNTSRTLQVMMNTEIYNNPAIQGNNAQFHDMAYKTHYHAYLEDKNLVKLSGVELIKILHVVEYHDMVDIEGIKLMIKLGPHVANKFFIFNPLLYPSPIIPWVSGLRIKQFLNMDSNEK